jgi:hypothetical protein
MTKDITKNLLISFFLGALIVPIFHAITADQPFGAYSIYYLSALLVTGFALGVFLPSMFWIHYFGIVLGQIAYAYIFLPSGPLWLIGIVFTVMYSLTALLGATLGRIWSKTIHHALARTPTT